MNPGYVLYPHTSEMGDPRGWQDPSVVFYMNFGRNSPPPGVPAFSRLCSYYASTE